MTVKFGLWRVDGESVQPVAPSAISGEERLEDIVAERIDILGFGRLLRIGRQVRNDFVSTLTYPRSMIGKATSS
jgi:hypothetical protein